MYIFTTYTRPLSVQAQYSRSCPIISRFFYNSSLVTWTVVCLTTAKFKSLIFCVEVRLVKCCEHLHYHDYVWLLLVACIILLYVVWQKSSRTRLHVFAVGQKLQYGLMTLAYQRFTGVLSLIYGCLFLIGHYYFLSVFWCAVARMSELLVKFGKNGNEIRDM
jgi:hypothetical protein